MASLQDIGLAAAVNLFSAFTFLIAFAILRLQPVNDRVYFPKWYLKGLRASLSSQGSVTKFVNLDCIMYLRFLKWMPEVLRMPEPELVEHAGLDSVAYIRIYLLGYHSLILFSFSFTCFGLDDLVIVSGDVIASDEISVEHRRSFCKLKIFVPIAVLAFVVLVPVNLSGKMLDPIHDLTFRDIDKLSISNVHQGSNRY